MDNEGQEPQRSALLGRWVHEEREKRGISRADLAKRAGCSISYLFRIEQYGVVPRRRVLDAVAGALGVTNDPERYNVWLAEARAGVSAAEEPNQPAGGDVSQAGEEHAPPAAGTEAGEADDGVSYCRRMRQVLENNVPGLLRADLDEIEERLLSVVSTAVEIWRDKEQAVSAYIASHGPKHHMAVVEVMATNLKTELRNLDPRKELLPLLAAVWLHDIGLVELKGKQGDDLRRVLDEYDQDSAHFVENKRHSLHLSDEQAHAASNLCQYHRNTAPLSGLKLRAAGDDLGVGRQIALIALLRLALLMEVRPERVREGNLLPYKNDIPYDLESELQRNLFANRIYRDGPTLYVDIRYLDGAAQSGSDEDADDIEAMNAGLKERLVQDLQGALDLVKDELVVSLKTTLLWVKSNPGPNTGPEMNAQIAEGIRLLSTSRSPNAARVVRSLLRSLERAMGGADAEQAIRAELRAYAQLRSYQFHVLNIRDEVGRVMGHAGGMAEIKRIIEASRDTAAKAYVAIEREARRTFTGPARFVLYGFSQAVLTAMRSVDDKLKNDSFVHVFECRPKAHHGLGGVREYCDGEEYARAVRKKCGFKKVTLHPDSSAAVVMDRRQAGSDDERGLPTYLLLGAEGIYMDGAVASTAGTKLVVLVAQGTTGEVVERDSVKVYVMAEGTKVRRRDVECGSPGRNLWLTGKNHAEELKSEGITLNNPGNEIIPGAWINGGIITEEGKLSYDEIAGRYRESVWKRYARRPSGDAPGRDIG